MKNLHRATGMLAVTLGLALVPSFAQITLAQPSHSSAGNIKPDNINASNGDESNINVNTVNEAPVAPATGASPTHRFTLGVNFTYKFAQIADPETTKFILPGISVDGAYSLDKKHDAVALVVELNGERASNIVPHVNLQQVSLVAGPRYTLHLLSSSTLPVDIYGQALGGYVFATDSVFPGTGGATDKASSGAFQGGGGVNLHLTKSLALRLCEADFIITGLPNAANNRQYDLRISNGLVFHF